LLASAIPPWPMLDPSRRRRGSPRCRSSIPRSMPTKRLQRASDNGTRNPRDLASLAGRPLRISVCSPELETGEFHYLRYFETFPAPHLPANGHVHRFSFGLDHIGEQADVILICCHGFDLSSFIEGARRR